jgi:hypothetical protein
MCRKVSVVVSPDGKTAYIGATPFEHSHSQIAYDFELLIDDCFKFEIYDPMNPKDFSVEPKATFDEDTKYRIVDDYIPDNAYAARTEMARRRAWFAFRKAWQMEKEFGPDTLSESTCNDLHDKGFSVRQCGSGSRFEICDNRRMGYGVLVGYDSDELVIEIWSQDYLSVHPKITEAHNKLASCELVRITTLSDPLMALIDEYERTLANAIREAAGIVSRRFSKRKFELADE